VFGDTLRSMRVMNRRRRRIDAAEIGVCALLFSVYASARGAAIAVAAARALFP
jgi:hypothetical protein